MEIFDYDNILLLPRQCRVESRSECDTGIDFGGCCCGASRWPATRRSSRR